MNYFAIAFKNLSRQKKRSFLLGGAISFGVLMVILVGALAAGILDNFLNNQASMFTGHILVRPLIKNEKDNTRALMTDDSLIVKTIEENFNDIKILAKRTQSFGTFINGNNSMQQMIIGLDMTVEEDIKKLLLLEKGSIENMADPKGIIVAHNIAESLQVGIGEKVLVKLQTINQVNNVGEFTIAGIISEDMGTMSALSAFANRSFLNSLVQIEETQYTELDVYFQTGVDTEKKAQSLFSKLEEAGAPLLERPIDTKERQEIRSSLDKLEWEDTLYDISSIQENFAFAFMVSGFIDAAGLITTIILLSVILVGIFNTLRITIYERTKEIGTMRALGMQRDDVRNLFFFETLVLALAGTIVGLAASIILTIILTAIPFDLGHTFFAIFLKNGHISLKLVPARIIIATIVVMIVALLASFFPARKAAKIDPAKAIHNIT